MKFFISLIFLSGYFLIAQESKKVFISCDVLGKKKSDVRYYHPIEGEYEVKIKNRPLPNNKELKSLQEYVLIQPQTYLKDSLTFVQANSLRHLIDLDELIYVSWAFGVDSLNNQSKLDSFENKACYTRDKEYAEVVDDYFSPFMMSRYEITNAEYREFVEYVKDSIMRELIYLNSDPTGNGEIEDEVLAQMLKHEDAYFDEEEMEWVDFDESDYEKNRELFSFNYDFDWRKELEPDQFIPVISEMYLRPNERYYTRRHPDVSKLVYRYYSIDEKEIVRDTINEKGQNSAIRSHINRSRFIVHHEIPIYPDTLGWNDINWLSNNDPMANMYFWHPAYDNYPVVGLSYEQVLAFIDWKQRKLEKEFPDLMRNYKLTLPNIQEIEWAVNSDSHYPSNMVTSDNSLITELSFGLEGDEDGKYVELIKGFFMDYTESVYSPYNSDEAKAMKKSMKRVEHLASFSNSFHSHVKQLMIMRYSQNKLSNGVEFLSNNVSEWVDMEYQDYEKLLDAYINYNCFADIDYCQYQRPLDMNKIAKNDKDGQLIMGSNWYDERYENTFEVNTGGIYPKRFADRDSSFSTVGFRLVLRSIYR
jgi:hypothetical protein